MNALPHHPAEGLWAIAWQQLRRKRLAMICLAILTVYAAIWFYAEGNFWSAKLRGITPNYRISNYAIRNQPPSAGIVGSAPTMPGAITSAKSSKAHGSTLKLHC